MPPRVSLALALALMPPAIACSTSTASSSSTSTAPSSGAGATSSAHAGRGAAESGPRELLLDVPVLRGAAKAEVARVYAAERLERVVPESEDPKAVRESWRYRELGVWFFFDTKDTVSEIRIEAPFAGDVGGVRIGDTVEAMVDKLGPAPKSFDFGKDVAHSYGDMKRTDWLRFDVDASGRVIRAFR